ncbi:MAG: hypothetical protein ACTSQP_20075, partial [Promethearchaeota archaeon]
FIDDLGTFAFENRIHIAALAVISNTGDLLYQTENFDLEKETNIILDLIDRPQNYTIANLEYEITEVTSEYIIAGMGSLVIIPFQKGVLVSFALPQADLAQVKSYLIQSASELNEIL